MDIVILTALCVGGATVLGGGGGLLFRSVSKRIYDSVMSFAAGVMLSASILGLILPSIEYGGRFGVFVSILGMFVGALAVHFLDMLVPFVTKGVGHLSGGGEKIRRVFLFVMAIAMHNLPEGIAAGVGFGTDDPSDAFLIATAIALQNIPEGIIVTVAMLGVGARPRRAFLTSAMPHPLSLISIWINRPSQSLTPRTISPTSPR